MSNTSAPKTEITAGRPGLMLTVATLGFAVNFWAWALLSPLGPLFRTEGNPWGPSASQTWRCSWPCPSSWVPWAGSRWAR